MLITLFPGNTSAIVHGSSLNNRIFSEKFVCIIYHEKHPFDFSLIEPDWFLFICAICTLLQMRFFKTQKALLQKYLLISEA